MAYSLSVLYLNAVLFTLYNMQGVKSFCLIIYAIQYMYKIYIIYLVYLCNVYYIYLHIKGSSFRGSNK